MGDISSILVGVYAGHVRQDGPVGWRIELSGVAGNRHNFRIHPRNVTPQIQGCILVGETADDPKYSVANSSTMRDEIKALYGQNNGRPIEVKIQEGQPAVVGVVRPRPRL